MKEFFSKYCKKIIIITIFTLLISLTFMLLRISSNPFSKPIFYVDALFIGGAVIVCIGGLSTVNYYGAFDLISYSFAKKGSGPDRMDFATYLDRRKEKLDKKKLMFVPYFVVGLVFILIAVIINIAFVK